MLSVLVWSITFVVTCLSAASAQSWQQVFPRFSVKDISSVVHWRGDTLFAAGSDWTLLRSTDNGCMWQSMFPDYCGRSITRLQSDTRWLWFATVSVSEDTYADYMDTSRVFLYRYDVARNDTVRVIVPLLYPSKYGNTIDLSVSQTCITVLEKGARLTLVQSTDGGLTWDHRVLPDSFKVGGSVGFLDKQNGWLIAKTAATPDGMVVHITHDGGNNWTQHADIIYPTSIGQYDSYFTALPSGWYHDSLCVLVTNGVQLCVSTDTGRTWQRTQPLSALIRSVDVDSANVCMVATEGLGAFASTDFGATWTSVRNRNASSVYQYPVIASGRAGIYIIGSRNGYIVQSSDAGLTWNERQYDKHSMLSGVRFFSDAEGWLNYLDLGTGRTCAARTVDGGTTLVDAFLHSDSPAYRYRFVSNDVVIAYKNTNAAGPAEVRGSTDQGQTWTPSFAAAWNDTIRFLVQPDRLIRNEREYFLACSQGLLYTRDGGATWVMHRALAALERLAAAPMIDMISPVHGWYLSQRRIYRTDDDGLSWTLMYELADSVAGEQFICLDAVDDSHVFAQTTPWTTFYVTTNAGGTWESYRPLEGISSTRSFANGVSYGIAGGASFNVYKTSDYWRSNARRIFSWSAGQGSSTNAALYVLDASTAWVTGYNVLWRTTDGGTTWCERHPATPEAPVITSIHPNPVNATATISYMTSDADPASVTLELRDLLGRCVRSILPDGSESSTHSGTIDCSALRSGVYFVTIRSGRGFDTRKLIVAR